MVRKALSIAALAMLAVISADAQSETNVPSAMEIRLLRERVAKAVNKYEPLLKREFYFDLEQKKRQVKEVDDLRTYLEKIGAEPQAFNGILGFVFLETLHDVEGYASACVQISLAGRDLALANACQDAALSMVDAINTTSALYARYIRAVSAKGCSIDPRPLKP